MVLACQWARIVRIFLVGCLSLGSVIALADSETLTLVFAYEDKEQYPNYLGNSDVIPEDPGVSVEMVQHLVKHVPGIRIELKRYPWKRCLALLEVGEIDAIFNASYTQERASFGVYPTLDNGLPDESRRLTSISYSWYARVGVTEEEILAKKLPVAAPAGYSIVNQLKAMELNIHQPPHSQSALKMVAANRVQAAALQTVTGDAILEQSDEFSGLTRIDPPIVSKAYYLLFSKDFYQQHGDVAEDLWDALSLLRETEMPALERRYTSMQ